MRFSCLIVAAIATVDAQTTNNAPPASTNLVDENAASMAAAQGNSAPSAGSAQASLSIPAGVSMQNLNGCGKIPSGDVLAFATCLNKKQSFANIDETELVTHICQECPGVLKNVNNLPADCMYKQISVKNFASSANCEQSSSKPYSTKPVNTTVTTSTTSPTSSTDISLDARVPPSSATSGSSMGASATPPSSSASSTQSMTALVAVALCVTVAYF